MSFILSSSTTLAVAGVKTSEPIFDLNSQSLAVSDSLIRPSSTVIKQDRYTPSEVCETYTALLYIHIYIGVSASPATPAMAEPLF